ncbi:MAG: tetratricopeptide repeat protein [Candidatus Acidiferrum sp.]
MKLQRGGAGSVGMWLRIGLAAGLLFCIYVTGKRAIGEWYFRRGTPESIEAAIKWDGDNPRYRDALGTLTSFYVMGAQLDESVASFEAATSLSPYDAHYWSDLGASYDRAGRSDEALSAFQRALKLFPKSPEINWRFANFAFRTRRTSEGLRALPLVLAGNTPPHRDVFRLATLGSPDKSAVLEMLPPQAAVSFEFVNFEMEAGDVASAEAGWQRLLRLKLPFEPRQAFPYLDALIQHQETDRLITAWSALAERFPVQIGGLQDGANLVKNGGFEHELLDGGLDWRIFPVDGAEVSVDSGEAFEGTRALRIEFDGKSNLDYGQVLQYVPVQANSSYRFTGAMRARGITTDSGPRFQVFDAYDMGKLFVSTENIVGTSDWSVQQVKFKTGASTRLVAVRVVRVPSQKFDNQIMGTVWIDQVRVLPDS